MVYIFGNSVGDVVWAWLSRGSTAVIGEHGALGQTEPVGDLALEGLLHSFP